MEERTGMRFQLQAYPGKQYNLLVDAATEANFLHAKTGVQHSVIAMHDEDGFFSRGEVVYTSKQPPE